MTNYEVFHNASPRELAELLAALTAGATGIEPGGELYRLTREEILQFLNEEAK